MCFHLCEDPQLLQIRDKQHKKNTLSHQLFSTKPCVASVQTITDSSSIHADRDHFAHATIPEIHKETEKTHSNSPQTHGFTNFEGRAERKQPFSCKSSGPRSEK